MQNPPLINDPGLATVGRLRRDTALAPGGQRYEALVGALAPLVHGAASQMLPERTDLVPEIVTAVFESFAARWRKLPRKTVVASWLLKTTCFVALKQHRLHRRTLPALDMKGEMARAAWKRLIRLPTKQLDAFTLRCALGHPAAALARALGTREARVEKRSRRALKKLTRLWRKHAAGADPAALLQSVPAPLSAEFEGALLERVARPAEPRPRTPLVQSALRAWRWAGFRRAMRRTLAAVGLVVLMLGLAAGTVSVLFQRGYATSWMVHHMNRQLLHEIPELANPARAWPPPDAAPALARPSVPATSAELYTWTNIWPAKLSFSPENWKRLQPSRVPLASMGGPDGQMRLRNPNASRSGLAGMIGLEFNWTEARLEFADADFPTVAVRYRGNGTYVNSLFGPKQSFKVDLNKLVKGQHLAGVRTLNFVNAIPDFSYLRDAMAERLFRDLGVLAPRTSYAYLTRDDQPLGLYVLIENLDADFALDRFGTKEVPIFKPVTTELFKDLGPDWSAYAPIYDLKTKATPAQRDRVAAFARLVTHADDAEFAAQVGDFLDLDNFAGFLAGHVLLSSYDGFLVNGQNFYLYLDPRVNKFGFIPWDQDHSWGEFGYVATADRRERASIWEPNTYDHRFLKRVLGVEAFREIYRRRLETALSDIFTVPRLYAQIDELAAVLRPAVAAESDFRLHRFDLSVSTNWVAGPRDGAPEGPKAPVHQLKRFIVNRARSVQAQLAGTEKGVLLSDPWRHER